MKTQDELLDELTNAFLRWPLPESVFADGCATIKGDKNRTGTNLLTFTEARLMFKDIVIPSLSAAHPSPSGEKPTEAGNDMTGTEALLRTVLGQLCDAYRILSAHRSESTFDNEEWCEKVWREAHELTRNASRNPSSVPPPPCVPTDSELLEYLFALMRSKKEPSAVLCGPNGESINRWWRMGDAILNIDFRDAIRAARDGTRGGQK